MKMSPALDTTGATSRLSENVVTRLESLPGVIGAAYITSLPLELGPDIPFEIVGHADSGDMPDEQVRAVSPHYFAVMRIPVVAGRAFTERDTQGSPAVGDHQPSAGAKILSETQAHRGAPVTGSLMGPRFADVPREIIGVVGDTHEDSLRSSAPPMLVEPWLRCRIPSLDWTIR